MRSQLAYRVTATAFAAAMTLAFSALPGAAQDNMAAKVSGPVSLWGGAHLTSAAEIALEGFLKENPDVVMSYEKYPYAEYPTKMRLQLSAGSDTPDVMIIHDFLGDQFVKAGWLADVSGDISASEFLDGSLANVTKDGKIYGMAGQSNPTGFWYRADVFDKLGIETPVTLDDYIAAAEKLKEADLYIDTFDPNDATAAFQLYLYQAGGSFFDQQGNVVLGDKAVEALTRLKAMNDEGYYFTATANQADYWSAVNSGRIVARFAPSSDAAYLSTNIDPAGAGGYGNWFYTNPPLFGDDAPKTFLWDGSYFVVNARSANLSAAIAVAKYLTSSDEAAIVYDAIDRSGIVVRQTPSQLDALKAVEKDGTGWDAFGGQPVNAIKASLLLSANPGYVYKDSRWNAAMEAIGLILPEVFSGNLTPEAAVNQMTEQLNAIQ